MVAFVSSELSPSLASLTPPHTGALADCLQDGMLQSMPELEALLRHGAAGRQMAVDIATEARCTVDDSRFGEMEERPELPIQRLSQIIDAAGEHQQPPRGRGAGTLPLGLILYPYTPNPAPNLNPLPIHGVILTLTLPLTLLP